MPEETTTQAKSVESMLCGAFAEVIEQRVITNVVTTLEAIERDLTHACDLALGATATHDKPKECAEWLRQIADNIAAKEPKAKFFSCMTIPDSSVQILRDNELAKAKCKMVKLLSSKDAPSNA